MSGTIDILLDAELLLSIFKQNRIAGNLDEPVGLETIFGYELQGRGTCSSANHMVQSFRFSLSDVDLGNCLIRFWEVESIPNNLIPSPEDTKCEQIFNDTVHRD